MLTSGQVGVSPLQSPQLPVSGAGQGQVITAVYPTPTGTSPVQSASHSVVYSVAATGTATVSSPTAILPKGGSPNQSAGSSNHSLISTGIGVRVMGIGVTRGKGWGELSPREKMKRDRRQTIGGRQELERAWSEMADKAVPQNDDPPLAFAGREEKEKGLNSPRCCGDNSRTICCQRC